MEYKRNGVVRGLQNREVWSKQWYTEMKMPSSELPVNIQTTVNLRSFALSRKFKSGIRWLGEISEGE